MGGVDTFGRVDQPAEVAQHMDEGLSRAQRFPSSLCCKYHVIQVAQYGERQPERAQEKQTVAHDLGEQPRGRGEAEREKRKAIKATRTRKSGSGRLHENMMVCTGQVACATPSGLLEESPTFSTESFHIN